MRSTGSPGGPPALFGSAVRDYLEHFWTHWSGPDHVPEVAELDRLADSYARPGAFVTSIN